MIKRKNKNECESERILDKLYVCVLANEFICGIVFVTFITFTDIRFRLRYRQLARVN